jgi:large-conductance mechanosensitive channel
VIEIGIFAIIAIAIFYYFTSMMKIKREERKERLREKREEYFNSLLERLREKGDGIREEGPDSPMKE